MRACFLIPTDLFEQPAAPVSYLRALLQARYLQRQGREVSVVCWIRWAETSLARLPARESRESMEIQRLVLSPPPRGLVRRARFLRTLTDEVAQAARGTGADAFVVHNAELLPAAVKAANGAPVFYDSAEHFPAMVAEDHRLEARLFDLLERRAANKLTHVYTVSEGIAERFRAMGLPTTVLYNSRPLAEVERGKMKRDPARRALGLAKRDFVVGFVGSLSRHRGLELLLDALTLATADVRAVVYGGPPAEAERLHALAAGKGLEGRALFPGTVEEDALFERIAAFDLGALLLPERGLNFQLRAPNKLFDYMAAGVPIVATRLPEIARILQEAGCGFVVDPQPESVVGALLRLKHDTALRENIAEAGRRAFRERYSWERMEERLASSHPFWRATS